MGYRCESDNINTQGGGNRKTRVGGERTPSLAPVSSLLYYRGAGTCVFLLSGPYIAGGAEGAAAPARKTKFFLTQC